jgi:hypothetical protein
MVIPDEDAGAVHTDGHGQLAEVIEGLAPSPAHAAGNEADDAALGRLAASLSDAVPRLMAPRLEEAFQSEQEDWDWGRAHAVAS